MTNTTPPTAPQLDYIRDLLTQLPVEVTGITDVPAAMQHLATTLTKKLASDMITQLRSLKANAADAAALSAPAAPGVRPAGARSNQHPGKCNTCKGRVPAGDGWIQKSSTGKWLVFHNTCPQAAAPAAPVAEQPVGLYCDPAGPEVETWRLYIGRQSGRRQAAVLVAYEDHGVFEFQTGGTTKVDRRVADGTLRPVTQEEANRFGRLHDWCVNCGLHIEDDRSQAAGYGPTCATNNGWHYPTYEEAARILGRPVTKPSGVVVTPEGVRTKPEAQDAAQGSTEPVAAPEEPRCVECHAPLADVLGEPCYQATPDYRGLYPLHTVDGLRPQYG